MSALHTELRKLLENTVLDAREAAEKAARAALTVLAVHQEEAYASLSEANKSLRRKLRAEARRLGDPLEKGLTDPFPALVAEVAYEQWHRLLFARFLAENGLLIHPEFQASVSLQDCADIAEEEGKPNTDAWTVASEYAAAMLPGIFRNDDPVLQVRFDAAGRLALENLLLKLPREVFVADDSLGWVYQFWQAKQKVAVNKSGRKIGGADIAPVTQLFTEHYMVEFLLHNSLGAWWAARHPDEPLPVEMAYLRRNEDGTPAAGTFPGWSECAAELKVLDPCCGSGHFLVAAFDLLRRMRMAEEGLDEASAGDAVLRDNLFGLELDPRCTQIAAFAVCIAAWKAGGYRPLPIPNIACCGLAVGDRVYEWTRLAEKEEDAKERDALEATLRRLWHLFRDAPDLGSLIDPTRVAAEEHLFAVDWDKIKPLLEKALAKEREQDDPAAIFGEAAKGVLRAAELLTGKYTLVVTNVPYLGRGNQDKPLREYIEKFHNAAKADLATAFVERCLTFCTAGGSTALVTPQNWLFLGSYKTLRERLLKEKAWNVVARLGAGAFETIGGEVVNVALFTLTNAAPPSHIVEPSEGIVETVEGIVETSEGLVETREGIVETREGVVETSEGLSEAGETIFVAGDAIAEALEATVVATIPSTVATIPSRVSNRGNILGIDASAPRVPAEKAALLQYGELSLVSQSAQLRNPDARITFGTIGNAQRLDSFAYSAQGIGTTDNPQFVLKFWEHSAVPVGWEFFQTSATTGHLVSGYNSIFAWGGEGGRYFTHIQRLKALNRIGGGWQAGSIAWGRKGFCVNVTRNKLVALYSGEKFDTTVGVLIPKDVDNIPALYCYLTSEDYTSELKKIDASLSITEGTLIKVPFDLDYWQKVAAEQYPDGLPEPSSDDPTQWLFHGHPSPHPRPLSLFPPASEERGDSSRDSPSPSEERTSGRGGWGVRGSEVKVREPLQVAMARLLGYRWPEHGLPPTPSGKLRQDEDGLNAFADSDGIVCLPSVNGEVPAEQRLLALLSAAYGADWSPSTLEDLLAKTGYGGKGLEVYLREGFFKQHCSLFHNRPFLWHIWDGEKDGFGAIVNYHKLDSKSLDRLIYTYLGNWIKQQSDDDANGVTGAGRRLKAASDLQTKLKAIVHGEPPYDIYVRWKPLHKQPLGWEPDLNDGMRLNIRPFVEAGVLRSKFTLNWNKDRGSDPKPNLSDTTERLNDLHFTRAEKEAARRNPPPEEAIPSQKAPKTLDL